MVLQTELTLQATQAEFWELCPNYASQYAQEINSEQFPGW